MKTNYDENKELLKHFLDRTFFKDFSSPDKKDKLFNNIELQINSKCNLDCKYCYYNQGVGHGQELNPNSIATDDNILENLDTLLDYFNKKAYYPGKWDIFGGEVMHQPVTFKILDKLIDFLKDSSKQHIISIPSNMNFLRNEDLTKKVVEYKKKAEEKGIFLGLSASVDGKYMDIENRPVFKVKKEQQDKFYNDGFYEKLFSFAKKYGCGFHPMVYYSGMEKWKDNFLWFQKKFKEYELPWNKIYLLEVRNDGWTKKSVREYKEFYKFVAKFAFEKLDRNRENFVDNFIFKGTSGLDIDNMNMFNNISKIGRGIGCSLQTTLFIRLGDLVVNSCHRQSYDSFNGFKFLKEDGKIKDIEPLNLSYYLATISTDRETWPYCESCLIKSICMSGCMGAQFEATGDPFTPISSVCLLEHGKVGAQIEFLVENGMFAYFLSKLPEDKAVSFKEFYERMNNNK